MSYIGETVEIRYLLKKNVDVGTRIIIVIRSVTGKIVVMLKFAFLVIQNYS